MSTMAISAFGSRAARVSSPRIVRLMLERGEICRLPRRAGSVAVRSGTAWIASRGRDYLLAAGQCLALRTSPDALLSGIGEEPLVVEVRAQDHGKGG
jgi:hypothetical protein